MEHIEGNDGWFSWLCFPSNQALTASGKNNHQLRPLMYGGTELWEYRWIEVVHLAVCQVAKVHNYGRCPACMIVSQVSIEQKCSFVDKDLA